MVRKLFVALVAVTSFSVVQARSPQEESGADLVVFNAKIYTGNRAQPEASALAIRQGRIYAVGSDAEILGLKSARTKTIDGHSRRLIPGIVDAHTHLVNDSGYNYNVRWDGVPTLARALAMLSEQAARTPQGQWVKVIGGWSPYQFKENRLPTLEELRKAVPNRPLIVQYAYNRAFLNSQGIAALGIGTAHSPNLPDAEIERDKSGKPTGVIAGNSWTFVTLETLVPQQSFDEQVSSLVYSIHGINRFGVTSVVDNGSRWGYPAAEPMVDALVRENWLNVRMPFVVLQLGATGTNMVNAQLTAITRTAPISPGQNSYPALAHGHEYRGFGEVLDAEVHDHENFERPAMIIAPEKMHRLVEQDVAKLVGRRIPFRMHISYNQNITPFLDALEKLNERVPLDGLRWSLEHAETITPEHIERVKKLGGGIALDHKMALHGDAFIRTHGREEALHTPRLRTLVESGIPLGMSTDAFRAATFNPWVGLSWMVTGKSVSGSEVLAKEDRLTRAEALKLFTAGGAWFMNADSEIGILAPGRLADFAILDRDYFMVPDEQIKSVSSVLTILNGRVVYGAQEYSALTPMLPAVLPNWSPVKYFGGYYQPN
jgi:predicted amidohydrolase YtcJ